jgi:hypothetical protein
LIRGEERRGEERREGRSSIIPCSGRKEKKGKKFAHLWPIGEARKVLKKPQDRETRWKLSLRCTSEKSSIAWPVQIKNRSVRKLDRKQASRTRGDIVTYLALLITLILLTGTPPPPILPVPDAILARAPG